MTAHAVRTNVNTAFVFFFYWLFGAIVFGLLASGHEHGSSLIRFAQIIIVGIAGGAIHAIVILWKERQRKPNGKRNKDE